MMRSIAICLIYFAGLVVPTTASTNAVARESYSLALPANGERHLHILTPTMLEITAITAGAPDAPGDTTPTPPVPPPPLAPGDFNVTVAGAKVGVTAVGYRRRAAYAPFKQRDLRIGHSIFLQLAKSVTENQKVEVSSSSSVAWLRELNLATNAAALRHSPVIHVNQVGYESIGAKIATVGYYLGSLGELPVAPTAGDVSGSPVAFQVVDAATAAVVHQGHLSHHPDRNMPHGWYRKVWTADFSKFETAGEYRIVVSGLGASYPFFIDAGIPAAFARAYALGLYHQRCGTSNAAPFTRFVHAACHMAPATVPTLPVAKLAGFPTEPRDADLFPYVRKGKLDVSGGHHDAGDYSKYTINSAGLIHHLIFAVDAFEGVAALDNLGLPESGDGKSDVLQSAKWESDFLAKMQDEDGGFYFLVYPRDRKYEHDVLPENGDPQIVWPKNSAATAAAVAALAQCSSSKAFQKAYPADAKRYLEIARRGWKFLKDAQAKRGGDIYRKFTHYGDEFKDADDLTWAACELYLATGEPEFNTELRARLNLREANRRWGWWRLIEGYGNATRSYAFAQRTGRLPAGQLDPSFVAQCENEIVACAEDWLRAARDTAYGVSFPEPTKRVVGGGWFFTMDRGFDLAVACQLKFPAMNDRRPFFREAIVANLNYEAGSNPVNVSFVTGLGWKRHQDVVHHYAQNDRRALPLSGIVLGCIQQGFHWMPHYKGELGALCYPLDGAKDAPYPILDRWGDSFNLQMEFVVVNQARALATAAWLMAQTPVRAQEWRPVLAEIVGTPSSTQVGQQVTVRLKTPAGLDPRLARIEWEAQDQTPMFGPEFSFSPRHPGPQWIEVEASWPDGRRIFGTASFTATAR